MAKRKLAVATRFSEKLLACRERPSGITDGSRRRLRLMRGVRTVSITIRSQTFVQNLRCGHYELGVEARRSCLRVAAAFDELATGI